MHWLENEPKHRASNRPDRRFGDCPPERHVAHQRPSGDGCKNAPHRSAERRPVEQSLSRHPEVTDAGAEQHDQTYAEYGADNASKDDESGRDFHDSGDTSIRHGESLVRLTPELSCERVK